MTDIEYHGWTNYSTWNVYSWMTGSAKMRKRIQEEYEWQGRPFTATSAKAVFLDCFPEGTPDMRGVISKTINWKEVAKAFNKLVG